MWEVGSVGSGPVKMDLHTIFVPVATPDAIVLPGFLLQGSLDCLLGLGRGLVDEVKVDPLLWRGSPHFKAMRRSLLSLRRVVFISDVGVPRRLLSRLLVFLRVCLGEGFGLNRPYF